MKSAILTFVAAAILLAGCASQPTQPDWIAGDSATYKSAQYLLGRGQAATQEEAKDRARADLAKIFQVAISVASEDVQKFKTGGTADEQYQSESSRRISTRTEQIVRGIQIAELWQNPATGVHHALAVLPRLQTSASLRQQIGQLDDATGNYIAQSRNQSDLFLKISAANEALLAQQERDGLQKSLQVVDVTGRGVPPQWNSATLSADLDALLKRVRIALGATADSASGFAAILAGALAQAGFMAETGQNPEFVLQGRLALNDLGLKDGWYWQRGILEITLTETAGNRVRGTMSWNIKASATDRENAVKRAMGQVDTILKQELRAAIIGMATSR